MTQRSFLFGANDADVATTRLISTAATATGFMKGEPGRPLPGWYSEGAENHALLATLRDHLAAAYPNAGPALWAVRLWTNLLWQPAYLSVIAVHLHGAVSDLAGLSQAQSGIYIDRYRLAPAPMWTGSTDAMIARAARQLRRMADALLEEVNAVEKLRPVLAQRLLAERMLGLMLWLGQRQPELTIEQIQAFADQWTAALALEGHGALEPVDAGGRRLLITKRKGCCLDYLIDPTRLCANCPKQDDAGRVARQTANALAEIG